MKRTKKEQRDPDAIHWIKTGGGSFLAVINGRKKIIKPGEKFWAKLEEIPVGHRDVVRPVDPRTNIKQLEAEEEEKDAPPVKKLEYFLNHRGGGWYSVLNSSGKVQNEKALNKEDAEKLIRSLTE